MRKSKIIKNQKQYIEELLSMVYDTERELKALREQKAEELLKDYKYAILVDNNYKANFWNDGRFEKSIKVLSFELEAGDIPSIIIEK